MRAPGVALKAGDTSSPQVIEEFVDGFSLGHARARDPSAIILWKDARFVVDEDDAAPSSPLA